MATHSSILAWRIPWTAEPEQLTLLPTILNLTQLQYVFTSSLDLVETEGFSLISVYIRVYVSFWNCLETHWCLQVQYVSCYHDKTTTNIDAM